MREECVCGLAQVLPILRQQIQKIDTEPLNIVGEVGLKALVQLIKMHPRDAKIQEEL